MTPDLRAVDAGWFDAAGIAVLAGETFQPTDYRSSTRPQPPRLAVIVDDLLARRLFPGQDSVIGERVVIGQGRMLPTLGQPGAAAPSTTSPLEIIGVVETTRNVGLEGDSVPQIYQAQGEFFSAYAFVLRTSTPDRVLAAVRPAVAEVDPDFLVEDVSTLSDRIAAFAAPQRFYGRAVGGLAVVLLTLALLTLYAIVAATVGRRTREIGVRVALGAGPADVWRWVLAQGRRPVASGAVLGMVAVWWLQPTWHWLDPSLGVPTTLAIALVIVAAAALAAHILPVRRALAVDPTTALRAE